MEDGGWGGRRPKPRPEDRGGEQDGEGATSIYSEESRGGAGGELVFQRRRRGSAPSCRMGGVLERVPGAGAEMGEGAND